MKLKITLLTLICFTTYWTQAQITATTYKEMFTGSYDGNWYGPPGAPQTTSTSVGYNTVGPAGPSEVGFLTLGNSAQNGTTTGVSDPWAYRATGSTGISGSVFHAMINKLQISVNTPGADNAAHCIRYVINTAYGPPAGGYPQVIDISGNRTFSVEVNNLSSVAGTFLVGIFKAGQGGADSYPWTGSTFTFSVTLSAYQKKYISNTFTGGTASDYTNIVGYVMRTSNMVGDIEIDNVRMGYALPTANFDVTADGGATSISAGNSLQISASSNAPEYDSEILWSVANSSAGISTIDSTGKISVPSSVTGTGFITVTGVSAYNQALTKSIVINLSLPVTASGLTVNGPDTVYVSPTAYTTYTATVTPLDAADRTITKMTITSAPGVTAIPSATGILLKATSSGVVIVTGYHVEGSTTITGTKTVYIVATVTGVSSITGPLIVTIGGVSGTYTGSTMPEDAINGGLTWSVSPSAKATISSNGVLSPLLPGAITVTGTSIANASLSKSIAVTIVSVAGLGTTTTGINTAELSTAITVYPNPVSDVLSISFSGVVSSVIVFNTVGTQVAAGTGNNISLASLPEGFYTVEIVTNLGTTFKSIIKRK